MWQAIRPKSNNIHSGTEKQTTSHSGLVVLVDGREK